MTPSPEPGSYALTIPCIGLLTGLNDLARLDAAGANVDATGGA